MNYEDKTLTCTDCGQPFVFSADDQAYLAQKGVAPDRMTARGYGPDQPVTTNRTRAGRAQNRRVELHLIEGQNQ